MVYCQWGQGGGPSRNFFLSGLWVYPIPILLFHLYPELPGKILPQVSGNPSLLALSLKPPSSPKPPLAASTPHYNTVSLDATMLFSTTDWVGSTDLPCCHMSFVPALAPSTGLPHVLWLEEWMCFQGPMSQKEAYAFLIKMKFIALAGVTQLVERYPVH